MINKNYETKSTYEMSPYELQRQCGKFSSSYLHIEKNVAQSL